MEEQKNIAPKPEKETGLSREELERRLAEAEQRARVAENDAAILRECIVRMAIERTGVLL